MIGRRKYSCFINGILLDRGKKKCNLSFKYHNKKGTLSMIGL
jgi:hypothetical protein